MKWKIAATACSALKVTLPPAVDSQNLGHVFSRWSAADPACVYCINSICLRLEPRSMST